MEASEDASFGNIYIIKNACLTQQSLKTSSEHGNVHSIRQEYGRPKASLFPRTTYLKKWRETKKQVFTTQPANKNDSVDHVRLKQLHAYYNHIKSLRLCLMKENMLT